MPCSSCGATCLRNPRVNITGGEGDFRQNRSELVVISSQTEKDDRIRADGCRTALCRNLDAQADLSLSLSLSLSLNKLTDTKASKGDGDLRAYFEVRLTLELKLLTSGRGDGDVDLYAEHNITHFFASMSLIVFITF